MWERVSSWVGENRRRIAGLVLVLFVLVVFVDLSHTVPRATELAFDLGSDHDAVRSVDLSYTCGDDDVREARHRYPEGAPSRVRETVDLVPGHYDVQVDLHYADGRVLVHQGQFDAPAEGLVVVQWRD